MLRRFLVVLSVVVGLPFLLVGGASASDVGSPTPSTSFGAGTNLHSVGAGSFNVYGTSRKQAGPPLTEEEVAAWNTARCSQGAAGMEAFKVLAAEHPDALDRVLRSAPDYTESEPLDWPWLYSAFCETREAYSLAIAQASTSLRKEAAAFGRAKVIGDDAAYLAYMRAYPGGRYAAEVDDLRWKYAQATNTPASLKAYADPVCPAPCAHKLASGKARRNYVYTIQGRVAKIELVSAPERKMKVFANLFLGLNQDYRVPNEFTRLDGLIWPSPARGNGERYVELEKGRPISTYGAVGSGAVTATSFQTVRYGGLMFKVNRTPDVCRYGTGEHPDLGTISNCNLPQEYLPNAYLYSDVQRKTPFRELDGGKSNGIWSKYWKTTKEGFVYRHLVDGGTDPRRSVRYATIKPVDIQLNHLEAGGRWAVAPTTRTLEVTFWRGETVRITWEFVKTIESVYDLYLTQRGLKCDGPVVPVKWKDSSALGPGFYVVNLTDYPLDMSLAQLGPLYYGLVPPGQALERHTGAVWFTIKASVNLDGVPKDNLWTAVQPVASIVGSVLFDVLTGGGGTVRIAMLAAVRAGTKQAAYNAGGALLKVGLESALINGSKEALKQFSVGLLERAFRPEHLYASNAGEYAGPPWPFRGRLKRYKIEGGPRAPCVDAEGNVVFRPSQPLRITPF